MIRQFKIWTTIKSDNVLILHSNELFNKNIKSKLSKFLKRTNLKYFPIKYAVPKTNIEKYNKQTDLIFKKYKTDIDYINNYKSD